MKTNTLDPPNVETTAITHLEPVEIPTIAPEQSGGQHRATALVGADSPAVAPSPRPIATLALCLLAVAGFHVAWCVPSLAFLTLFLPLAVYQLSAVRSKRWGFYSALALGLACYAPHLLFFSTIFGPAAFVLWSILAAWLGVVALAGHFVRSRLGTGWAAVSLPVFWTAAEFVRSELYYLRFSWLSLGYTFSEAPQVFTRTHLGVYGLGFLIAGLAAMVWYLLARDEGRRPGWLRASLACGASLLLLAALMVPGRNASAAPTHHSSGVRTVALQLEYPMEDDLLKALESVATRHPDAPLVTLSEYTLQRPPTPELRAWCRRHQRHLIVGGKDPLPGAASDAAFRNTAFVIDPAGEIVFRQVKSVPIQFFQDGERAREQKPWASPWGAVGLAVCYDLSYRRVMDELIRQGAGMLVIPTADEAGWGAYEHRLHARVARVRAAEYGVPILRVAGSGISQHVDARGRELASAPFPGQGEVLVADLTPVSRGRLPLDVWLAPAALVTALGLITGAFAVRAGGPSGEHRTSNIEH